MRIFMRVKSEAQPGKILNKGQVERLKSFRRLYKGFKKHIQNDTFVCRNFIYGIQELRCKGNGSQNRSILISLQGKDIML